MIAATPYKTARLGYVGTFRLWGGAIAAAVLVGAAMTGCTNRPASNSPYSTPAEVQRQPTLADQLNQEAADLMWKDPAKAEEILRNALTADLYHGPAHNNLGVLYLRQGKLYEAAAEFEWARRLLPGHPDPRLNLGIALETAGKTGDAMKSYRTALEVYPNHIPTLQAITRLQVRTNDTDAGTRGMLEEIAMRGETEAWRDWARQRLTRY